MKKAHCYSKNTFENLPEEKRRKVLRAAVKEFSRQGYRKASINTIIKELGIAKGSLYQYFTGKEALFLYIFGQFTQLVKLTVKRLAEESDEKDFFSFLKRVLLAGIQFIDLYPDYFQIYLNVLFEQDVPERDSLIVKVRLFSAEYFGPLCVRAQARGEIRQDVSIEMVIFIIDAAMDRFLQTFAQPNLAETMGIRLEPEDQLHMTIEALIKVLREGLATPKS